MGLGIPQRIVARGYQSRGAQLLLTQGYFAAEEPKQSRVATGSTIVLNIERTAPVKLELL